MFLKSKTNVEFATAITNKKPKIKTYAETLTSAEMTNEAIKDKVMNLVGTDYAALKDQLTVAVTDSATQDKKKITLTVANQNPIIIDDITPTA